jgi:hypothetical protein
MFPGYTELLPQHLAAMKTVGSETLFGVALFGHLAARVSVPGVVITDGPGIDLAVPIRRATASAGLEEPDWWRFLKPSAGPPAI